MYTRPSGPPLARMISWPKTGRWRCIFVIMAKFKTAPYTLPLHTPFAESLPHLVPFRTNKWGRGVGCQVLQQEVIKPSNRKLSSPPTGSYQALQPEIIKPSIRKLSSPPTGSYQALQQERFGIGPLCGHYKDPLPKAQLLDSPCSPGCRKTRVADSRWWWPGIWGYSSSVMEPSSVGHQRDAPPSWPPPGAAAGCGGSWWHRTRLTPPGSCVTSRMEKSENKIEIIKWTNFKEH